MIENESSRLSDSVRGMIRYTGNYVTLSVFPNLLTSSLLALKMVSLNAHPEHCFRMDSVVSLFILDLPGFANLAQKISD